MPAFRSAKIDEKLRGAGSVGVCYVFNVGEACMHCWAEGKESTERGGPGIPDKAKSGPLGGRQAIERAQA